MAFCKFVVGLIGAGLVLSFWGCGGGNVVNNDKNFSGGTSAALFKIAASPNSPFSKLARRALLTITAGDMETFNQALTVNNLTVEGTVTGIPAGKNRSFVISVFDSLDTLQYRGTATADLPRGSTVNVPITLYRIGASAIINGNVVEAPNKLVAYYPFTGNAIDMSDNGHNGTANDAVLTTDRFGTANAAYSFNGTTSDIDLGKLPPIDTISISIWFKKAVVTGYPTSSEVDIFGTQNSCNNGFKFGFHVLHPDQLYFYFSDKGCTPSNDTWIGMAPEVPDTSWHHAVVIRQGIKITLTLDNVTKVISGSPYYGTASGIISTNAVTKLGTVGGVTDAKFKGKLDDVRIYSRSLNATEIASLYHEGGW